MKLSDVQAQLERLARARGRNWTVSPGQVSVPTVHGERHHVIRYAIAGDHIVLTATILKGSDVTRDESNWRKLAILAWMSNAEGNLVTYCFDDEDRLIARIQHLAACIDEPELELYVETLAAESDRVELVLTGEDWF